MTGYLVLILAGWTSGISIYLTVALLGISQRAGWIQLPGQLVHLSNILIIGAAILIYAVEFVADKIPFVDSLWDWVHTSIRPIGAGLIGYTAGTDLGPVVQTLLALGTGTMALDMHAVKSSTRLAINTSPEPFSNIGASLAEQSSVFLLFWFFIKHPILASALILGLLVLSFFFLRMLWRFVVKIFRGKRPSRAAESPAVPAGAPSQKAAVS